MAKDFVDTVLNRLRQGKAVVSGVIGGQFSSKPTIRSTVQFLRPKTGTLATKGRQVIKKFGETPIPKFLEPVVRTQQKIIESPIVRETGGAFTRGLTSAGNLGLATFPSPEPTTSFGKSAQAIGFTTGLFNPKNIGIKLLGAGSKLGAKTLGKFALPGAKTIASGVGSGLTYSGLKTAFGQKPDVGFEVGADIAFGSLGPLAGRLRSRFTKTEPIIKNLVFKSKRLMTSEDVRVVDQVIDQFKKSKDLSFPNANFLRNVLKSVSSASDEAIDVLTPQKIINEVQRHANLADKARGLPGLGFVESSKVKFKQIDIVDKFDKAIAKNTTIRRFKDKFNKEQFKAKAFQARTALVDKFAPLELLTRSLRKSGKLVTEKDPFKLARLFASTGSKIDLKFQQEFSPILKSVGDKLDIFSKLLLSHRIIELSERGIKRFPGELNAKDAKQYITRLSQSGDFERLEKARIDYKNFMNQFLLSLRDNGIISKESFNNIRKRNLEYTPFGVAEYLNDNLEQLPFGSKSLSVASQDVIKQLKGSTKEIVDPLEQTIRQVIKITHLVERNKVAQSLANLTEIMPNVIQLAKKGKLIPSGFGKVSFFKNGIKKDIFVPKEIEQAIKGLTIEQADLVTDFARKQSTLLRAGATTYNIGFLIPNIIRDITNAKVVSKHGLSFGNWLKGFMSAMKQDETYDAWIKSGGGGSTISQYIGTGTQRSVAKLAGRKGNIIKRVITSPKNMLEELGRVSEESTRIGIFKQARQKGETLAEAAFQSREGTVDFSKSGTVGKLVNMWVPFLNARTQGTVNLFNALKKRPAQTGLRLATVVGIPAISTYLWNRQFKDYDDIPDFEKDTYFYLIARDRTQEEIVNGEDLKGIKIPKGDVGKIFGGVLENILAYADKRNAKSIDQLVIDVLGEISPIGITPRNILSSGLPPFVKGGIETITNQNLFTGFDIEPEFQGGVTKENLPTALRAGKKTGPTARAIGSLTGRFGLSPAKFENLVGTTTAGLGKQALQVSDVLFFGKKGLQGKNVSDIPIVQRFAGIKGGAIEKQGYAEARKFAQEKGTEKFNDRQLAEEIYTKSRTLTQDEKINFIKDLEINGKLTEGVVHELELVGKRRQKIKDEYRQITGEKTTATKQLQIAGQTNKHKAEYIIRVTQKMTPEQKRQYIRDLDADGVLTENLIKEIEKINK